MGKYERAEGHRSKVVGDLLKEIKARGRRWGLIRADLELGDERRVMVIWTSDLDGRLRKLESMQRLGKLRGTLLKMADRFHVGKIVFSEICECDGDLVELAADYRRKLQEDGFKVYGGPVSEAYRVITVKREHRDWVVEGVKAIEKGVSVARVVDMLRTLESDLAASDQGIVPSASCDELISEILEELDARELDAPGGIRVNTVKEIISRAAKWKISDGIEGSPSFQEKMEKGERMLDAAGVPEIPKGESEDGDADYDAPRTGIDPWGLGTE